MLSRPAPTDRLVRRVDVHFRPDPARVVNQLFVAGEELISGSSRVSPVMQRVLAMSDLQADAVLADVLERFDGRHPHLAADLMEHFKQIGDRLRRSSDLSDARRMLLGAYATNEYSVEAAALCNPSIVPHPDQGGLGPDELRFVLSLRAVGEGHLSSIEFRTGVIGPDDHFRADDPGHLIVGAELCPSIYDQGYFRALLVPTSSGDEIVSLVLNGLPPTFTGAQLEASIARLRPQVLTRAEARATIERIRSVARSNYSIAFPVDSEIAQRVIRPHGPTETHGMEDARFVHFVNDDGSVTYYATYTAFDGTHVSPQLMQTDDFRTFQVSQLTGRAATNKGMALFPRRINGRYYALSRWDRESNAIATSADGHAWDDPEELQSPTQPWELVQIGNCGSPIETSAGWVVLTHGVGPMRTYSLGAVLLDLDDPTVVVGKLSEPLLTPDVSEREGYVPNVVYTCGALRHRNTIVLPYAYGDRATTLGLVSLPELLDRLRSP